MVVFLSLRVLASRNRLGLLDRRLLHRPLSWVRHPATFAFSTGACCTVNFPPFVLEVGVISVV
jgi:hypothetical protein